MFLETKFLYSVILDPLFLFVNHARVSLYNPLSGIQLLVICMVWFHFQHIQSCALEAPKCHSQLTFAFGQPEKLNVFIQT